MSYMQATAERRRLRFKLKHDAFDRLVKSFHGDKRDYEIGAIFGVDDSEWSLIKTGKRYVPIHVLAVCTTELFPGVLLNAYTDVVEYKSRGNRS